MSATGKKFAEEFLQIGEVKLEDKVLVQDSEDGLVKYALVDQFNAAAHKEFEDFLKGEDADEIINKWSELEKVLAGLKETDDLATILSEKFNTKDFTKEKIKETLGIYDWALEATPPSGSGSGSDSDSGSGSGSDSDSGSGSGADFPLTYDAERDAWELKGNLVITKGLATYTKLVGFTNLDVMGGIKVDRNSIYINSDGELAVVGGAGGGLDESALADYLTTNKYATQTWVTNQKYFTQANFTKSNIKSTLGISDWALEALKPSYEWSEIGSKPYKLFYSLNNIGNPDDYRTSNISGYAYASGGGATDGIFASFYSNNFTAQMQFKYNTAIPYVRVYDNTASAWSDWKRIAFHSTFDNYVPLATAKDITAIHNFVNGVKIGGKQITYNSAKNALVLPFNVIIEGGLATYTKLSGFTNLDVMGGVVVDNETIAIVDGALKYIGGTSGGGSVSITGAASTIVSSNLTASRALVSNSSGKVAVSSITSTKLGYLTDVTSNIQAQINGKQATLVSGSSIKTINNQSILGSGNITISGGISSGITLWGQSFDGTSSVSGAIANTGSITPSATHTYNLGSSSRVYEKAYLRYIDTDSYDLRICCNGNERIHIAASNGYVGIGTTSPTNAQLQVAGDVEISEVLRMSYSGASAFPDAQFFLGSNARIGATNNGTIGIYGRQIFLRPDSTTSASSLGVAIDISGNMSVTGSVTENSDRKLKDMKYEGDGLDLDALRKVKVAKWHWKDKRDKRLHIGGVADNLAEVMPEVVFESEEEDGTTTSSIAYGKAGFSIAASLIAPVVRHEDRIKELEKNIEKMQKELKQLRTA